MSSKTPKLSEVLESAIGGFVSEIRVALPGRVLAYDSENNRATVQVQIPDVVVDGDGQRTIVSPAALTDVPVALLGSGAGRIKWPVKRGHEVLCLFSSSALAQYKATRRIVDPGTDRHHHIADAIAIPVCITEDYDDTIIEFTEDGQIHIGGDAQLATKADLQALKDAIVNAIVVAADGGASLKATILAALTTWPVGTTKLKGS
jgi:hypothetical protein